MKKNKKYTRTLREDIRMILRGYKLVWQMSPANFLWRMAYVTTMQISPYFTLYMSAWLLDELSAGASAERLLTLAAVTVIGAMLISILNQNVVGRQAAKYESLQFFRDEKFMADIEARMQYCHLESPETALIRNRISTSKFWGGNGLMQIYWSIWFITEAAINIIASVSLTASMLTMSANGEFKGFLAFANSPWSILIIVFIIAINIIIHIRVAERKKIELDRRWEVHYEARRRGYDILRPHEDSFQMGMKDFLLRRTEGYSMIRSCLKMYLR